MTMTSNQNTDLTRFAKHVLKVWPTGGARWHELAALTGSNRVAVYSSVQRLHRQGYVCFSSFSNLISLTQKGQEKHQELNSGKAYQ